ncbi:MAG: type II secretion system protein [Phycisphaerae bacterium]|nr:type II secretion system protein [Phycisphaerae bacterium]
MSGTSTRQVAFTLIELLVVITILGLLVAITVPSLGRALELSHRAACSMTLKTLGDAANMYASEQGSAGYFPTFHDGDFGTKNVGLNRDDADPSHTHGNTRGWYKLVRFDYCSIASFHCASDELVSDRGQTEDDPIYDFQTYDDEAPISYSLQVTKITDGEGLPTLKSISRAKPIAADRNGLRKWEVLSQARAYTERDESVEPSAGSEEDRQAMSSPNHDREGTNVLRADTSVTWEADPFCGIERDNIWTWDDGTTLGEYEDENNPPAHDDDSYLMP